RSDSAVETRNCLCTSVNPQISPHDNAPEAVIARPQFVLGIVWRVGMNRFARSSPEVLSPAANVILGRGRPIENRCVVRPGALPLGPNRPGNGGAVVHQIWPAAGALNYRIPRGAAS